VAQGAYFTASSAGQFTDNFVWNNVTGVEYDSSNHNWVARNRITQSGKQGLYLNTDYGYTIVDNQFYQNSMYRTNKNPFQKRKRTDRHTLTYRKNKSRFRHASNRSRKAA